jgi:hypothetical protein
MSLFPETATGEWRFPFAESVPIPVNGSNLETQVMVNPSPPWAYWDPASYEKPVAWYLMT